MCTTYQATLIDTTMPNDLKSRRTIRDIENELNFSRRRPAQNPSWSLTFTRSPTSNLSRPFPLLRREERLGASNILIGSTLLKREIPCVQHGAVSVVVRWVAKKFRIKGLITVSRFLTKKIDRCRTADVMVSRQRYCLCLAPSWVARRAQMSWCFKGRTRMLLTGTVDRRNAWPFIIGGRSSQPIEEKVTVTHLWIFEVQD